MLFAWDEWNVDHIAKHNVVPDEAEYVIEHASTPWPQEKGDGKLVVWGPSTSGRLLQVIFVLKLPEEIDFDALTIEQWAGLSDDAEIVYVVHAMDLTDAMKRQYRRRRKPS